MRALHRDLHSFPTRRSSDLSSKRRSILAPLSSGQRSWRWRRPFGLRLWASRNVARDRKSTRLNSSHANISYAVFCLKKKKAQKREEEILLELRDLEQIGDRI